ncbi:MAG: hypothetical protein F4Z31_05355 [Gemmatimonadetes bacterium]|nr:hypothetical protein [Gemmatimonadota bacterium]MYF08804.1 hypothetical protein [Rhodospirillaceae bacterium]
MEEPVEEGGGDPDEAPAVEGGVVGPGFVPGWPFDGVGPAEGPAAAEPLPGLEIPEPVEAPEEEDPLAGLGRVFRLCGRNPAMKAAREELLALVWVSQGKVAQGEAAKITGRGDQGARSGLRRATEDGWLVFLGDKFWQLADDFITDLDLLARAVEESDLELAEAVGKGFKGPLVRLDAAWLDHRVAGPTPREEIRALADEALAMAVDQWPDSKVLRKAVDKLYSS